MEFSTLIGLWLTVCIQTQVNGKQGHVIESYSFSKPNKFEFERQWFKDAACKEPDETDVSAGSIKLGNKLQNSFFGGTSVEADFKIEDKTELGSLAVKEKVLKVARGFGAMRNTMLGVFEYKKQK